MLSRKATIPASVRRLRCFCLLVSMDVASEGHVPHGVTTDPEKTRLRYRAKASCPARVRALSDASSYTGCAASSRTPAERPLQITSRVGMACRQFMSNAEDATNSAVPPCQAERVVEMRCSRSRSDARQRCDGPPC